MQIKIPKKPVIFLTIIIVILSAFLLGSKFSSKLSTTSSPETTSQTSVPTPTILPQVKEGKIREIKITAKQFEFIPSSIRVKLGDNVRLKISSIDVTHGFLLPEFGINEVLEPGKEVVVEFQATKKGEFSFSCSVPCGSGHTAMRGALIVE